MPYTDDKRIRDLQTQVSPLLNDFIAMDRTGALEATKLTLQQLANLISLNVTKQLAYADIVAPDNALGVNGDLFFRVPADGSLIQMYQKIGASWASVFTLPINSVNSLIKNNDDIDTDGNMTYSVPSGKTIMGVDILQTIIIEEEPVLVRKNLFPSYDSTKVYGFEKLTGGDTQVIILKIG